ncbi:MAG TPA: APC family permease [Ktedonobacteraceae bacterium]|nr:APC family permease [Ktedonobacteraceae bacterium]
MEQSEPQVQMPEDQDKTSHDAGEPAEVVDDPALLRRREVLLGKYPGQERIRIVRPSRVSLQRVDTGLLKATEASMAPASGFGRVMYRAKRFLIGSPLANEQAVHERLTKFKALAVLSSDAISSVAYATEACMGILILAGSAALGTLIPITIAIIALLAIVALSYSQTIPAYPNGGGSYIVAKDNLGTLAGLVAAAALLIDYVLTVSVSVTSGVQNLAVIFQGLNPYIVEVDILVILIITIVNLRGIRESGSVFAIPTYFFIVSAFLMIIVGLFRGYADHAAFGHFPPVKGVETLGLFLILRAFASGCSAMTGTEAISNGVPAFKKPEPRNARITLIAMATILALLFAGITLLTMTFGIIPQNGTTVIGQIAARAFGNSPLAFMYPVFQISILLILTLAANTSYADFPRLASLLARDHFLPHQFAFRGDRLAFSIGIIFLAILAGLLEVTFNGNTDHLIDLYAVGVFISFTLSQTGMVWHWWRLRGPHWRRSIVINGLGAVTTLTVAAIITISKFALGAWVVVVLIPLLVLMFIGIHRHYTKVERERTTTIPPRPAEIRHLFIVPIAALDAVSVQSLSYARSITRNVTAVHVAIDEEDARRLRKTWREWIEQIGPEEKLELVIIESPYRSLNGPLLAYIDTVHELYPDVTLTVLLPEFVVNHWWEHILHNQTALRLKAALLFRPGIVVTNMPQHLVERTQSS